MALIESIVAGQDSIDSVRDAFKALEMITCKLIANWWQWCANCWIKDVHYIWLWDLKYILCYLQKKKKTVNWDCDWSNMNICSNHVSTKPFTKAYIVHKCVSFFCFCFSFRKQTLNVDLSFIIFSIDFIRPTNIHDLVHNFRF